MELGILFSNKPMWFSPMVSIHWSLAIFDLWWSEAVDWCSGVLYFSAKHLSLLASNFRKVQGLICFLPTHTIHQERLRKAFAAIQTLYGEVFKPGHGKALEKTFCNRNVRAVTDNLQDFYVFVESFFDEKTWNRGPWHAMGCHWARLQILGLWMVGAQEKTCCLATLGRSGRAPRQGWRMRIAMEVQNHPTSNTSNSMPSSKRRAAVPSFTWQPSPALIRFVRPSSADSTGVHGRGLAQVAARAWTTGRSILMGR